MACCVRTVTWECCYPDPCDCCDICIPCACCNSNNCSAGCASSTICGQGACCTCNSNSWGYAWKVESCPCGFCPACGSNLGFNVTTGQCGTWFMGQRFDTHNEAAESVADLTKSLFMEFAPLSQGKITNMRITNDPNDTVCACT